jgi:hypothetical protein
MTHATPLMHAARWPWIGLSFCILALTMHYFDGSPESDVDALLIWGMMVMSFPAGLAVILVLGAASYLLGAALSITVSVTAEYLLWVWLVFLIVGYLQWFTLVPLLLKRRRARNPGT